MRKKQEDKGIELEDHPEPVSLINHMKVTFKEDEFAEIISELKQ